MKMRTASFFLLAGMLLGAWAGLRPESLQAKKPARRTSPTYTVMVSLQTNSPYVPDGRMSFADLAFSATFKDVAFIFDPAKGAGLIENHGGRLFLTRHEFNDVFDGEKRHRPWVEKAWPTEFTASLLAGWTEKAEAEPGALTDDIPIVPLIQEKIKIGFYAHFGMLNLEWLSNLGSGVLSSMLFEFEAPWRPLLEGKPVTLKLPYESVWPEEKGVWWIEFIPDKK